MLDTISIVAPVFNESSNVRTFAAAIDAVMQTRPDIKYELFLVDDGSTDDTWECIATLSNESPHVTGVKLSKNFGQDGAIFAGLSLATGDATIVMDSDLQHPPNLIPEMLSRFDTGFDIVSARKSSRPDQGLLVRLGAHLWGRAFKLLTGYDVQNTTTFRLISSQVREQINSSTNRREFFRFESNRYGFSQSELLFDPAPRAFGTTKFNAKKLSKLALRSITSSTTRPLHFVSVVAILTLFLGVILAIQTVVHWANGSSPTGFTTIILLVLFMGGAQMMALGIIGEYIGELVEVSKKRPMFVIEMTSS